MALGKWTNEKQQDLFIAAADMPRSPGHPLYGNCPATCTAAAELIPPPSRRPRPTIRS